MEYQSFINHNQTLKTVPEYIAEVIKRLHKAHCLVCDHLKASAEYVATWYDRRVHPVSYVPGDLVRVYNPTQTRSLSEMAILLR